MFIVQVINNNNNNNSNNHKKDFTEPIFLIIQTKLYLKVMVKDLKIKSTEWRKKNQTKIKEIINEKKEEEEEEKNQQQ